MPVSSSPAGDPAFSREAAAACAGRARALLLVLGDAGTGDAQQAKVRHDLRGRLATLEVALEVLDVAAPESELFRDARQIAAKHTGQLEQTLGTWEAAWGPH